MKPYNIKHANMRYHHITGQNIGSGHTEYGIGQSSQSVLMGKIKLHVHVPSP